jgi:hypothetical protein
MPTRPARVPLEEPIRSYMTWPVAIYSKTIRVASADKVPAAAERVVLMAASADTLLTPTRRSVDPGLNPYQPNQRMKTPRIAREALWPGMSTACTTLTAVDHEAAHHRDIDGHTHQRGHEQWV